MRLHLPLLLNLVLLLSLLACKDLETGEPPEFAQGFKATAISESQIELTWSAGEDDFNDADELRYGIWLGESADDIDLEGNADIVTKEGVLAYSLNGLTASTTYHVIVRASDRGGQYSAAEASDVKQVDTPAPGAGTFGQDFTFDVENAIDQMITGNVFNTEPAVIGLINDRNIKWLIFRENGDPLFEEGPNPVAAPDTVQNAYLVNVRNRTIDDLFVETSSELYFYRNSGDGFISSAISFDLRPEPDSVRFGYIEDRFEALGFMVGDDVMIYTPEITTTSVSWEQRGEEQLGLNNPTFQLGDIDNDGDLDLIVLAASGLAQHSNESSEDTPFDFAQAVSIDSDVARNVDDDTLLVADGDNDGNLDIYIFTFNSEETTLRAYKGNGDGTFADGTDADLNKALFSEPRFQDVVGSAGVEFLAMQFDSNNVAIHTPPSGVAFRTVSNYVGGRGAVDFYAFGDMDGDGSQDLALFSNESGNRGLTLVLGKESQTGSTEGDGSEGDGSEGDGSEGDGAEDDGSGDSTIPQ